MGDNHVENDICSILLKNEKELGNIVYLKQPKEGVWYHYTWREVVEQARKVRTFLYQSGLKSGDKVAIISKNCAEWLITDFGIALANMVSVPLFPNQSRENIEFIFKHAEVRFVFIGKLDNPKEVMRRIPDHYPSLAYDYHQLATDFQWQDLLACEPAQDFKLPEPQDLYTIIYTSGTTGNPKGAVYDHGRMANFLEIVIKDVTPRLPDLDKHHFVSYLPLAHVFERANVQITSLKLPSDISFLESQAKFSDNLQEIKPTIFQAVPRVWGLFKKKIESKLPPHKLNLLLKIPLISWLVKRKIIKTLGFDRLAMPISGASHLPVEVLEFFHKLGIIIVEGYGQTECLAYCTVNNKEHVRKSYVGPPRLGITIKKAKEDELLVKASFVMNGYYKDEAATRECFTEEGWLRTGDAVEIDEMQRVKILGRLSDTFKNQKGEFVHPVRAEEAFDRDNDIDYLCLIGQGLPGNILIVNLSEEGRRAEPAVLEEHLKIRMGNANRCLHEFDKIASILVVDEEWNIDNNLITPTLKVKRRFVFEKYKDMLHEAFTKAEKIVWQDSLRTRHE